MGTVTQYAVEVALLLCAVYLLYKWSVAGCTFCRFNRKVLIMLYVAAFIAVPLYNWLGGITADDSPAVIVEGMKAEISALSESPRPSWPMVVSAVYVAGVIIAIVLTLRSVCRIARIIREGATDRRGKFILVFAGCRNVSPFSWGKYIVVPAHTAQEDREMIIAHEEAHLRHRHWVDLAFGQAVIIFNWFNPAAYLMMKELQEVHEFEADKDVIMSGVDRREYQMLLLRNVTGSLFPLIADSLNHSQIRSRLRLMTASGSNPFRKIAMALAVPMMTAIVIGFNLPIVASPLSTLAGASMFSADYDEVEYVVAGNVHTIQYMQDGKVTSVGMDGTARSVTPNLY